MEGVIKISTDNKEKILHKEDRKKNYNLINILKIYYRFILIGLAIFGLIILFSCYNLIEFSELIQIIAIISPFIILYINSFKKSRDKTLRLKTIVEYISNLLNEMNQRSEIITHAWRVEILQQGEWNNRRPEFNRTADYVKGRIKMIRNYFDINDLITLQCFFTNPEYDLIAILNKYQIGIHGIYENDKKENFVNDTEKIEEIIIELNKKVI
ncbi:MAG: hypothetical protein CEE43_01810 [Promethearchaeota archaeon Loki_b32]|nr:MAG: hypothetical protein CEE43_01810 [Candidatus Lokiarchaeota archaeon Loki_b32]